MASRPKRKIHVPPRIAKADDDEERKITQLPEPSGFQLLIALPEAEELTPGGLVKATETRHYEEIGTIVGFVLKLGKDAYTDKKRFPSGAYCKEGDFIMMRSFSGQRFTVYGKEMRLINDDSVLAVVDDPRGVIKVV